MRRPPEHGLRRLAAALRLLASAALLALVIAVFYRPMRVVLGPKVLPAVGRLHLPALFGDRPAEGFLLQITTRPPGAAILVDGAARGNTPAILNVVCKDGQEVSLVVLKQGFPEFRRTVTCRPGQTAVARIDLGNPGG